MRRICFAFLVAFAALAQSDRGTITGTIADPTGAVIAKASITARNTDTGSQYETVATGTGNYTLAQLPAGTYELSVNPPASRNIRRPASVCRWPSLARIDVTLRVGETKDSVTVTADASLLKADSGEQSQNMTTARMSALPLNFGASGTVRNPFTFVTLLPGGSSVGTNSIRINGGPTDAEGVRVEGQEATNALQPGAPNEQEPSVESIQEISVQTSNFAAEYGDVEAGCLISPRNRAPISFTAAPTSTSSMKT